MDKRVQLTKAALKQGSSHLSLAQTTSHKNLYQNTVSHGNDTQSNLAESAVHPRVTKLKGVWQISKNYMRPHPLVGLSPRGGVGGGHGEMTENDL